MPGIHVRSFGKLDWVERGNEPTLTIPGAYWLCHKKRIYKFTFKWHKSLRNTEGFAYPKELTKVIRRVIKSQPRQGQQFGTRHLLVTYNQSAWLRQDKMFAMLKFREKTDATAFSHAFVLTVQTLNDSSIEDPCDADQDNDCTFSVSNEANNVRVQEGGKNTIANEDGPRDSQRIIRRGRDVDKDDKINESGKIIESEKSAAESASSTFSELRRGRKNHRCDRVRPKSIDNNDGLALGRKRRRNQSQAYGSSEKRANKITPDSPVEKGIAADFADLPYQYIIEREIEDSKGESKKVSPTMMDLEKSSPGSSHKAPSEASEKSLPRSPRDVQTDTARSADITDLVMEGLMFTIRQDQDSITVVEQKTKLEMDEVLENSEKAETKEGEKCLLNSSLLRLEGLITKIEVSEARSKSSENMERSLRPIATGITPLDNAIKLEYAVGHMNKDAQTDRQTVKSSLNEPRSSFHSQSIGRSQISSIPKFPLVAIHLNNIREVLTDILQFNTNEDSQKSSESSRKATDTSPGLSPVKDNNETDNWEIEEEEEEEVGLELKYDEKDDSESIYRDNHDPKEEFVPESQRYKRHERSQTNYSRAKHRPNFDSPETPIKDPRPVTSLPKTPRIVSNEIVTADQIPPALQKVLRKAFMKRLADENEYEARRVAISSTEENFGPNLSATSKTTSHPLPSKERISLLQKPIDKLIDARSSSITATDIIKEFQRELNIEKSRKQLLKRKSLCHGDSHSSWKNSNQQTFAEEPEIRLEMWKFMQDITRGAKVVVRRLDLSNISNGIASHSSLPKYNNVNQRIQRTTES